MRSLRVVFFLLIVPIGLAVTGCGDTTDLVYGGGTPQPTGPTAVRLIPDRTSYAVGDTAVFVVTISRASNVGAVAFHLGFDPEVLQFVPPATEGPFMSDDGTDTTFLASESPEGELSVAMSRVGSGPGASGVGTLARFRFLAIGPGPCDLRFTEARVLNPQASTLPAQFSAARVSVTSPASALRRPVATDDSAPARAR